MNWIKNIVSHILPQNTATAGADEADKKRMRQLKMEEEAAELAQASEEARKQGALLSGIVKKGRAKMARGEMFEKARAKVQKNLDPAFDNPDIVDEVTERILEAALNDPHYKKWVDK